jgi:hypothetical protein
MKEKEESRHKLMQGIDDEDSTFGNHVVSLKKIATSIETTS